MAALLLACPARAQDAGPAGGSVSDYRLPPGPSSSPSRPAIQGPTDPEHPVTTPNRPAGETEPSAPPASRAIPAPRITLPPATGASEGRAAERRERAPASRPTPSPSLPPQPTIAPDSSPAPAGPAPASPAAQPSAVPMVTVKPAPTGFPWPVLLAGLTGLLVIAIGLWLWLRPRPNPPEQEEVAESEAAETLPVSAPATLAPIGASSSGPPPAPPSAFGSIEFRLEPQSLRLSFVYATLGYRLTLTNRGDHAFSELRVAADMTSGHASQPVWQLLSPDSGQLPELHRVSLAAGETLALEGSIQLPLADVLPLRAGQAMLLAPLARFRVEGGGEDGGGHASAHVFSIGLPSASRTGMMQPFPLDHGPQLFRPIEQREVEIERWLQRDEAREAG